MTWALPRWEDVSASGLHKRHASLPPGKRALFEYRGDLFTVPVEEGSWRNITRSSGVADRIPVWSPDGEKIAWFNDEGGEYGLVVANQDGSDPRQDRDPRSDLLLRSDLVPGRHPAGLHRHRLPGARPGPGFGPSDPSSTRTGTPTRSGRMNPVWSPDSRWIAYARRLDNQLRAIFVHDTRRRVRPTSSPTGWPTPSPRSGTHPGKYLYFLASTNLRAEHRLVGHDVLRPAGHAVPLPGPPRLR